MNKRPMRALGAALLLAVPLVLAACRGGGEAGMIPQQPASSFVRLASSKIQHVVIIVQENRSFNNLFYGFSGATTVKYGFDSHNHRIALKPVSISTGWDLAHNSDGYYAACNGVGSIIGTDCRMNGFDKESVTCNKPGAPRCPIKNPQYSYVPHNETAPYFAMAKQYVLADKMFPSNFDSSSYVSHQYIIAGQAASTTNYPYTWWGCPGGLKDKIGTIKADPEPRAQGPNVTDCFNYRTLGDELDGAGLSWAFYAAPIAGGPPVACGTNADGAHGLKPAYIPRNGIWSAYQAVQHICYGPDWNKDIIVPQTRFLTDVKNGKLRAVTWIVPTCKNSDHPGCYSNTGPSWVTALVNAVGKSKFWDSSAIFIFWDDYGGLYDPVPPDYVDYDGVGIRVPMIVISPYARKGVVSHTHYEHGSILKFIEDRFALDPLSASDRRATSPDKDCFDFSQPPRKFVPFRAPFDENYFLHQPLDPRPPDTG